MDNKTIISSKVYRPYPVVVYRRKFYTNFLIIESGGFDVILGMY